MDYLKLEVRTFEEFNKYGSVSIYFTHTENYTLMSIPAWNWSFMWDFSGYTDDQLKEECIKALSVPMFDQDAEKATERIVKYLLWNK